MAEKKRGVGSALAKRALNKLEEATGAPLEVAGHVVVAEDRLHVLEAGYEDYRVLSRELEMIGYGIFDYMNQQPQEIASSARRKIVQRARHVWANDPQAGAAVELMNDFVFGRGMPRPRARDKLVQKVIDDAWDDPDNQEVLTSLEAQLAIGVDLCLQSNLFFLLFDDGEDGKVKLSILRHDDVVAAVPDPEKRHRVLYYVAQHHRLDWDYDNDAPKPQLALTTEKPSYYEHWRNVELAKEEAGRDEEFDAAPADRVRAGKVYHVRINRGSEQIFGVPRFQRTLRWYSAYNDYVKDRLDVTKAAASLIMKNKMKGSPTQIASAASKLISRSSSLTASVAPDGMQAGPRGAAGIWNENESATLEPFNVNTQAGNAQADAQIIRAPIAAAERWTQAYFGDASNSNLATATSLELPILKMVESRQEVFKQLVRWFLDRVIEKAVDDGIIDKKLGPDEMTERQSIPEQEVEDALMEACRDEVAAGREVVEVVKVIRPREEESAEEAMFLVVSRDEDDRTHYALVESHEDKITDEQDTERDLGYEFDMPSPLRRMMSDLIGAVTQLATTFDPNNTNPNLSRALLTLALAQGLEVENAPDLVDEILPEGWVDPMQAATFAQQGMDPHGRPLPQQAAGFTPADAGKPFPGDGAPARAPAQTRMPEQLRSGPYNAIEAEDERLVARGRDGREVVVPARRALPPGPPVEEAGIEDMAEPDRAALEGRRREVRERYREEVVGPALAALDDVQLLAPSSNGNGAA